MNELGEIVDLSKTLAQHKGWDQTNNPRPVAGWGLDVPTQATGSMRDLDAGKLYWRFGITHEVYEWLLKQVGPTGTYVQWAEGDPEVRWLYTGCNQLNVEGRKATGCRNAIQIRFRTKADAMVFKLTWWNKL